MDSRKNRPFRLRNQTVDTLQKNLTELRNELASLRVNKVASGVASKLAKIRVVRKTIARHLTIVNQKKRQELKDAFSTRANIKKYNEENKTAFSVNKLPKDLRPKLTKALRRQLSTEQRNKKVSKQIKKLRAFPQRAFALKA